MVLQPQPFQPLGDFIVRASPLLAGIYLTLSVYPHIIPPGLPRYLGMCLCTEKYLSKILKIRSPGIS